MSYTNTEKLYDALINYGYTTENIGSNDTFIAGMSDHQTRKRFYDYIVSNGGFRIGDYAKYEERLASDYQYATGATPSNSPSTPTAGQPPTPTPATYVISDTNKIPVSAQEYYNPRQPSLIRDPQTGQFNRNPLFGKEDPIMKAIKRQTTAPTTTVTTDPSFYDRNKPTQTNVGHNSKYYSYSPEQLGSIIYNAASAEPQYHNTAAQAADILRRYENNELGEDLTRHYLLQLFPEGGDLEKLMIDYEQKATIENDRRMVSSLNQEKQRLEKEYINRLNELPQEENPYNVHWGTIDHTPMSLPAYSADPQLSDIKLAIRNIEEAEKRIEATHTRSRKNNGMVELGKGVADNLFDINTFTLGLQELSDNIQVKAILDKYDNNEQLTQSEEDLLYSTVLLAAVEAAYDPGMFYKVGAGFAESIPFIIEFIYTGGISNAITKGANKKILDIVAKLITRRADKITSKAGRFLTKKALRTGAGLASGSLSAAVRLPFQFSTYNNILRHNIGETNYTQLPDGQLVYTDNIRDDMATSFVKGIGASFITNLTETFGGQFINEIGGIIGKGIPSNRLWRTIKDKVRTSGWGQFMRDAGYQGAPAEFFEELMDGSLNAIFIGDQSLSDVYSADNLIQTAGVTLLTSVFMGAGTGIMTQRQRHKINKAFSQAEYVATRYFNSQEMQQLNDIALGTPTQVSEWNTSITHSLRSLSLQYNSLLETLSPQALQYLNNDTHSKADFYNLPESEQQTINKMLELESTIAEYSAQRDYVVAAATYNAYIKGLKDRVEPQATAMLSRINKIANNKTTQYTIQVDYNGTLGYLIDGDITTTDIGDGTLHTEHNNGHIYSILFENADGSTATKQLTPDQFEILYTIPTQSLLSQTEDRIYKPIEEQILQEKQQAQAELSQSQAEVAQSTEQTSEQTVSPSAYSSSASRSEDRGGGRRPEGLNQDNNSATGEGVKEIGEAPQGKPESRDIPPVRPQTTEETQPTTEATTPATQPDISSLNDEEFDTFIDTITPTEAIEAITQRRSPEEADQYAAWQKAKLVKQRDAAQKKLNAKHKPFDPSRYNSYPEMKRAEAIYNQQISQQHAEARATIDALDKQIADINQYQNRRNAQIAEEREAENPIRNGIAQAVEKLPINTLEQYIARLIALGQRLRMSDQYSNGLSSELGITPGSQEHRELLSILSNTEGMTPEQLAHHITENIEPEYAHLIAGRDAQDIRNTIIDTIHSGITSRKKAYDYIAGATNQLQADEQRYYEQQELQAEIDADTEQAIREYEEFLLSSLTPHGLAIIDDMAGDYWDEILAIQQYEQEAYNSLISPSAELGEDRGSGAAEGVVSNSQNIQTYDTTTTTTTPRFTQQAAESRTIQPSTQPSNTTPIRQDNQDTATERPTTPQPTRNGSTPTNNERGASQTHSTPQEKEIIFIDPRQMSEAEKQRRGDMLRNAFAIEVQKNVITSTPDISARKAAEKWWDENVAEPALYDTEVGEVEINKNSVESSLAHRYGQKKLDAITSLIDGFENAVYLGTMPDSRERGVVDHYFAYPIMYDGELNYVFCRAMQDANKNRLYVHEVFLGSKMEKGDTLQTAASKPHGGISLYRDILANVLYDKDTTSSLNNNNLEEKIAQTERRDAPPVRGEADTENTTTDSYTITPTQYTTKRGNVLDMQLVKFANDLTKEQYRTAKELAKADKGWYDRDKGGFMMRSEESAKQLADTILNNDAAESNAQPISIDDIQALNDGDITFTGPVNVSPSAEQREANTPPLPEGIGEVSHSDGGVNSRGDSGSQRTPIWQYSIHVDTDGYTVLTREDVSSGIAVGDALFSPAADSPEEMLEILRNPHNNMQEVLDAVGVILENKIKTRELDRKIAEQRKQEYETPRANGVNGYKIGEKVIYKGKEATIYDFEEFGAHQPVLDTGMAPVIYELAEWSDIQRIDKGKSPVDLNTPEAPNSQEQITNQGQFGLVSDDRMAQLKERLRRKLGGQMNIGIDPEILSIGLEIAVGHLDRGIKSFTDFARTMIADLGDTIRPYLKAFYNGARELPEVVENGLASDMTPYDEVQRFDVANFDKQGVDALATAQTVQRETEVANEVKVAKQRIKRSTEKKKSLPSPNTQLNLFDNPDNNNKDAREQDTPTNNRRTQPRREELPETKSVEPRTPLQHAVEISRSKRGNTRTSSNQLGNRPLYDVDKNYSNEEISQIVSSVTDIVDDRVVITAPITDDIRAICHQYKSGGVAKKGHGILDEYYTDGKIVDAVSMLITPYFNNSNAIRVLEPSVGVGNFISAVDNIPTSEIVTFEINPTTARIAKILYPGIDVNLRSFETEFIDDAGNKKPLPQKYNLIIGNPPYGSHRGLYKGLGEESKIARYEDYFVKRSLDVLNEGGILAMVLPSSWIDRHTRYGGYTIEAAYRLPSGAFEATQVGTDIVLLRKDSSIPTADHTPYFQQHPERVLGEVKQRKGRYGKMEDYVQGDIDTAIETIKRDYASQIANRLDIAPSNDNLNNIEEAIDETGSPDKATAIIQTAKTETNNPAPSNTTGKKSKYKTELNRGVETVPTSLQFSHQFSEGEVEAFADADYDGTIHNPAQHRQYVSYMGGKAVHDFYYAEGDIYAKLAQLEQEKDYIIETYGTQQYEKQKQLLQSVLPQRKGLSEITISPNTTFVKNLYIDTDKGSTTLRDAFIDFCEKLPYQAFGDSSSWEVRGYVDNEQVYGQDKERNALVRERRKRVANDLFVKFLNEELSQTAQNQVVAAFNREYNSTYRPDYSRVPMFSTINKDFRGRPLKLTSVQLAGIGRMTVKGVGVLAHEVGFGKTLSGILAMHEAMTRGFATKPLIVVPNDNILKQWVETIKEVLPQATVNTLGNLGASYDLTDFKVNDGEFTLVTYEGLKAMSFSDATYNSLASKFSYITEDLNKHQSERDFQKELEKKNELKGKMKRGTKASYQFEDFGFDWLTFDEVHNANHIVSKVRLDKSVSSDFRSQNQRTSDLGLKTWLAAQYIQELNDGRNVLLLSATPFTNKPLEYYSILSLVANDMLERKGFFNIDQFFSTFMEADNELEIGANGRPTQKTNVRRFRNNGLFQQLLSEFIDIKGEEDNPELVRPNRHNKEYKINPNELTEDAMAAVQDLLNDNDTVLQGIGHARAAAFSPYATSLLGITPKNHREFVKNSPKINATIKLIEQNKKDRPDAGQIIYSEVGVEFFPMIRDYLVNESGFKPSEVRIITGATSNAERVNIQSAFNKGEVKVVIGSPAIKEGLNLQENTTDMYILSLPWNFTQLRQIEGRGWRQGNKWENIRINYMLTNNSVDVFMLQRLQLKQGLYNEAMKKGAETLDVSDIDTSELKTALITDPAVRAEIVTVQEREKLKQQRTQIEADLSFVLRKYESYNKLIEKLESKKYEINQFKEWAAGGNSYWADRLLGEENKLNAIVAEIQEEKERLQKKGVNVDEIEQQTSQAQKAIEDINQKIENLKEYQEELTAKYRREQELKQQQQGDLLATYINERKAENNSGTFYKIRPKEGEKKIPKNISDRFSFRELDEQTFSAPASDSAIGEVPQGEGVNESSITPEEQDIIDQAQANGTYLLAPNGQPTNLTPRQWVQVRTRAFKRWFGDWEKQARIEKLRNSTPINIVFDNQYDLNRDSAKQWMKDNIRGEYTNKDTGEIIQISRVGINEVTSHGTKDNAHLVSISAIPQLIENSIFIEEIPNKKDNDKYDSYRYYVCGAKINGDDYTIKVVIGVKGDSKYYDHRLTQIEKGILIDNLNGLSNSVAENQNASYSMGKDSKLLSILQTNASKIVDENGEPSVVRHNTNNEFNIFKDDYRGSNTGDKGVFGAGHYFGNIGETDLYGIYEKDVYLNIRNPKILPHDNIMTFFNYILDNFNEPRLHDINIKDAFEKDKSTTLGQLINAIKEVKEADRKGELDELISQLEQYYGKGARDLVIERQIFKKSGVRIIRDLPNFISDSIGSENFSEQLKKAGYDGVIKGDREYVAFTSNQIKSATDNIGTFDSRSSDIRFRKTSSIDPYTVEQDIKQIVGISSQVNHSHYVNGTTDNGETWQLRISDHPARYVNIEDNLQDTEDMPDYFTSIVITDIPDSITRNKTTLAQQQQQYNHNHNTTVDQVIIDTRTLDSDNYQDFLDEFRQHFDLFRHTGRSYFNDDYGARFRSTYDIAQQVVTDNMPRRIEEKTRQLAQKLGVEINVIHNNNQLRPLGPEYNELADWLDGKIDGRTHRTVGMFDSRTNQLFVFAHTLQTTKDPIAELERTITHEVVAHYGLRQLLGNQQLEQFMSDVWQSLPIEEQYRWGKYAMNLSPRHTLSPEELATLYSDRHTQLVAAEEYIAHISENGVDNPTIWDKICSAFRRILRRLGLLSYTPTQADIRYLLAQSYHNLTSPTSVSAPASASKIGEVVRSTEGVSKSNNTLFRTNEQNIADNTIDTLDDIANQYEQQLAEEKQNIEKALTPQPGDDAQTVAQKILFRATADGTLNNRDNTPIAELIANDPNKIALSMEYNDKAHRFTSLNEAHFDSMQRLSNLLQDIKKKGGIIDEDFDPWITQNQAASRAQSAIRTFNITYRQPLYEAINKAIRKLFPGIDTRNKEKIDEAYYILSLYVQARTAVERQAIKERQAREEAAANGEEYQDRDFGGLSGIQYAIFGINNAIDDKVESIKTNREKLSILAQESGIPTVQEFIDNIESKIGVPSIATQTERRDSPTVSENTADQLWNAIQAISEYQLSTSYQSGITSRSGYQALTYGKSIDLILQQKYKMQMKAIKDNPGSYDNITDYDKEGNATATRSVLNQGAIVALAKLRQEYAEALHAIPMPDNNGSWQQLIDSGWMSADEVSQLHRYYKFYSPLKGHAELTAEDFVDYEKKTPRNQSKIKAVEGHTQLAKDPFNQLILDTHGIIRNAAQNQWRLHLYEILNSNPYASQYIVEQRYYKIDTSTGQEEFVPYGKTEIINGVEVFIPARPTAEELANGKAVAFNNRRTRAKVDIPIRNNQRDEHSITVMVHGEPYTIFFYDKRIADAINGRNIKRFDSKYFQKLQQLNRLYAGLKTSFNPTFNLISNLRRDWLEMTSNNFIAHGAWHALLSFYNRIRATRFGSVQNAIRKYQSAKLRTINDATSDVERYVVEFFENGGAVNITQLPDYNTAKVDLMSDIETYMRTGKLPEDSGMINYAKNKFSNMAERVELAPRIATYIASRTIGRSVNQSVNDAKEATVNFDRKGAWSGVLGLFQLFYNASAQSVRRQIHLAKHHPIRFLTTYAMVFLASPIYSLLLSMLLGDADDWEENCARYFSINPELRRRYNIILIGDRYIRLPMAVNYLPYSTLGDIIANATFNPNKRTNYTKDALDLTSAVLDTFIPSIVAQPIGFSFDLITARNEKERENAQRALLGSIVTPFSGAFLGQYTEPIMQGLGNYNFMGGTLYDTPFNKNTQEPSYIRARQYTQPVWIWASQLFNDATGGNEVKKGWMDVPPEAIENLMTILGGWGEYGENFLSIAGAIITKDTNTDIFKSVPLFSRLYGGKTTEQYNKYMQSLFYTDISRMEQYSEYRKNATTKGTRADFESEYTPDERRYFADIATLDKVADKIRKTIKKYTPEGQHPQYYMDPRMIEIYNTANRQAQSLITHQSYTPIDDPYYIYMYMRDAIEKNPYLSADGTYTNLSTDEIMQSTINEIKDLWESYSIAKRSMDKIKGYYPGMTLDIYQQEYYNLFVDEITKWKNKYPNIDLYNLLEHMPRK